jgi:hypothetical protein
MDGSENMSPQAKREAIAAFERSIKTEMDKGQTHNDAVLAVARKSPAIHQRFLEATHRGYRTDDE